MLRPDGQMEVELVGGPLDGLFATYDWKGEPPSTLVMDYEEDQVYYYFETHEKYISQDILMDQVQ